MGFNHDMAAASRPGKGGGPVDRRSGGPSPVRPVHQPDAISCGATAAFMVVRALGFHPELDVGDIKVAVGTNPRTGTVPRGLLDGLERLNITASFERPKGANGLRRLVLGEDGKGARYVLLRTLIGGFAKHWIVCDGAEEGGPRLWIVDPASASRRLMSPVEIESIWSVRHYDSIVVPADREAHPALRYPPLRSGDIEPPPGTAPPEEVPLRLWCGDRGVSPEAAFEEWQKTHIANAERRLQRAASDPYLRPLPCASRRRPDVGFFVEGGLGLLESLVALDGRKRCLIGGIDGGTTWVHPDYRGQGLGAEILLAAHAVPIHVFTAPVSFSIGGYRARLKAHKIAVQEAIDSGRIPPDEVMADYVLDPSTGRIRLASEEWDMVWREAERTGRPVMAPGGSAEAYEQPVT